jgi:small subunit ribosomal protein S19
MKRSIWKGNFISPNLLSQRFLDNDRRLIWSRNSTIPEKLIGKAVFIHNGKNFIKSYITREKVGLKFGEFSYTRKFTRKENKVKNKKK